MSIKSWSGTALIIGSGDIGNEISKHLVTNSPMLDVLVCSRNLKDNHDISH